MNWRVVCLLVSVALLAGSGKGLVFSALRMCDSEDCDLDLTYSSNAYNFTIPLLYLRPNPTMSLCYRVRVAQNGTNGTCFLNNFEKPYKCLLVKWSNGVALSTYTADATLTPDNSTIAAVTDSSLYSASNSSSTASITFNTSLAINTIYELVVGNGANLLTAGTTKLVYFHTFRDANVSSYLSTGILMQRYYQCYQYYVNNDYNYNLIFYGGVVRAAQDVMFFSFLSFLSKDGTTVDTSALLNVWGGLSFSTSHAGRDMIGFSSGLGYTYDLYSLFAAAPYNDTSLNINGTNDFTQTFTSNEAQKMPFFYASGGYRLYTTPDLWGDEVIRKKIDYQFCYAVGYSTSATVPIEPTMQIKHSFVDCFKPNIVVWEGFLSGKTMMGLLLLMIIVVLH